MSYKKINSKSYWNNRFSKDWDKFSGPQQTLSFTKLFLKEIPMEMVSEIKEKKYTICDLGCAEGEGTQLLHEFFPESKITGIDFSQIAISKAQAKYPNIDFKVSDISKVTGTYDVIYCSNTLEHLEHPNGIINKVASKTKKFFILQVPFNDQTKHEEHINQFTFGSFKEKYDNFSLQHFIVKDTRLAKPSYWPGYQLIAIFKKNPNKKGVKEVRETGIKLEDYQDLYNLFQKTKEENSTLNKNLLSVQKDNKEIKILKNKLSASEEENKFNKDCLSKIYNSKTWQMLFIYKRIGEVVKSTIKKIIPIYIRKKIKFKFQSVSSIPNKNSDITLEIQKDWKTFLQTDSSHNQKVDYFFFSVIAWDFRYQRPQHLANNLGKSGNRVFYVKNEFLINKNMSYAPIKVEKKSNFVYEVTLSATKNLFIYNDKPSSDDQKMIISSIKTLIMEAGVVNPIAIIDHPFWAHIMEEISMPVIYDCMDNHQGFSENSKDNSNLEKKLFKKSDLVVTTSKYLTNLAKTNGAEHIYRIPNAGEYAHFSQAYKKTNFTLPDDMPKNGKMVIGYYGAIADWFDDKILEKIAIANKDKSIVLIGEVTNKRIINLAHNYNNIFLLGEKKYKDLPAYLCHFDVCIIPFVLNELIKATHPVKVYEYLAAGKPVVATKMPEIFDLEKNIFFSDPKNFCKNINLALESNSENSMLTRRKTALENTWIARANKLLNITCQSFFPKVSIIILSYNNPELIENVISSILKRSFYLNIEIIIVDNCSDQKTIDVLKTYENNSNIKIIYNKENYGFSKGNNIGLEAATGDYLILLNNDTIITPGWISRLLFHVKKNANIGIVGPVTNNIGNEAKINISYNPNDIQEIEQKAKEYTSRHWGETLSVRNLAAFCWIFSRKTYDKFGRLDEQYGLGFFEDDDYCHMLKIAGMELLISDDVFVHHFGSASFGKFNKEKYEEMLEINKKKFETKWKTKWRPHKYRN